MSEIERELRDDGKVIKSLQFYRNPKVTITYDVRTDALKVDYDEEKTTLAEKKRFDKRIRYEFRRNVSDYSKDKVDLERLIDRLSQNPDEGGWPATLLETYIANRPLFHQLYNQLEWIFESFSVGIEKLDKETNMED